MKIDYDKMFLNEDTIAIDVRNASLTDLYNISKLFTPDGHTVHKISVGTEVLYVRHPGRDDQGVTLSSLKYYYEVELPGNHTPMVHWKALGQFQARLTLAELKTDKPLAIDVSDAPIEVKEAILNGFEEYAIRPTFLRNDVYFRDPGIAGLSYSDIDWWITQPRDEKAKYIPIHWSEIDLNGTKVNSPSSVSPQMLEPVSALPKELTINGRKYRLVEED